MEHTAQKTRLLNSSTVIDPLKKILIIGTIGSVLAFVNEIFSNHQHSSMPVGLLPLGFLSALLLFRKHFYFSSAITALSVTTLAANALMIRGNGIYDNAMLLHPTMIVFACVLLNKRIFWGYILLSLLMLNTIFILGIVGVIQVNFVASNTISELININLIFIAFSILVYYLFKNILDTNAKLAQTNHAVQQSEARFRSIIENSPIILVYFAEDTTILYTNLPKKSSEESSAPTLNEFLLSDQISVFQNLMQRAEQGITEMSEEINWKFSLSSEDQTYSTIVAKVTDDVQKTYIALISDITENKLLQRQLFQIQKMELLGSLAGSITHDFNNTINIVSLYTDKALRRNTLDEESRKDFQFIHDTVLKAAGLTRKILTLNHQTTTERFPLNINDVVGDVEKLLRKIVDKNIDIEYRLDESLFSIQSNSTEIEQVLMNLVINARDAIRDKKTHLEQRKIIIETRNSTYESLPNSPLKNGHSGKCVILSVQDNGCGIQQDILQKIFQPFFTTKGKEYGTGLGLATVKNIIHQHNATVHIESNIGSGTQFTIAFPLSDLTVSPTVSLKAEDNAQFFQKDNCHY